MIDGTSGASSSSAGILEDIFRLIPPHERAAFREMLDHELRGRRLPDDEMRRVVDAHGTNPSSTVGREPSALRNSRRPPPIAGKITIMPARSYLIFGDIEGKLDVLRVECTKCARKGRYSVRRLIEKYGRKANMMKWKEQLNGDCPKRDAHGLHERPSPHRAAAIVERRLSGAPQAGTALRG